ncbi:dUTP diphosphatase [Xiamenia xianingshaonis]|uniref:Deoxyuridine 5'-triphosphate nucleotidohydrolase n=1 Tax=Xiamenia xianingshaonis TaxID=2682776 RepID=A0A9E6MSK1_9ACTN|nr:dUTP diphosphatase [Xiamenia xianingshaonis]NHM13762.1 dUTP diphosphatase [Xiamenia xianingshaonis]NHM16954.1 dUTP diphosphatase [Xiamenia xianingshaonis]QTU85129.1 dUTP diphosphatase [Xiamenia xianingshaonis]
MNEVRLNVQRLNDALPMPRYAYPGDAGLDLRSSIAATIEPGGRLCVPTGIAVAIPAGYAGFVLPRSGLAKNHGIGVVNAPGLIDSNYRGEVCVILHNSDTNESFTIEVGDRIAQLVVLAVPTVELVEVDRLDETQRNAGGFGSSGLRDL